MKIVTKTKTFYQCEICGTLYLSEEMAKECEAQGTPEAKFSVNQPVSFKKNDNKKELKAIEKIYVSSDYKKFDLAEAMIRTFTEAAGKIFSHRIRYAVKYLNIPGLFTMADEEDLKPREE